MKKNQDSGLTPLLVLLLAATCGLVVANIYYAQPLIDRMGNTFHIPPARLGGIVTATQLGAATGLLLLVPLGDMLDNRRLILLKLFLMTGSLLVIGSARTPFILMAALAVMGMLAAVTQTMVAYAARLADTSSRGRVVGIVTSGIVTGLLLARTVAGAVADFAGWRAVYFISAAAIIVMSLLLFRYLPAAQTRSGAGNYTGLLQSLIRLFVHERILLVRATIAMLIFAAGQALWTPMVLPLTAAPLSLSHTQVGMFGLAGAAGALGAARAGRLADSGYAQWTSGIGLGLMALSWLFTAFLPQSLVSLTAGIILFDLGLQAVHVTNQAMLLQRLPDAGSRVTGGYMLFYSIGSAGGSIAATTTYDHAGWTGVCILGGGIGLLALLFWAATMRSTRQVGLP
ncbi:MFS transporter [Chitinophaga japonensis]|uniref:Putative MFS family arabinose efflux permease n=1 Tax=Chitinophaga japonensis TaxID=104662 RepID=A0A562T002_CHIJA|nr:MFS transporter [Chitinophaga japonensis]TWI86841.1 putative MFS family arabinose efflux permease [Chitinophaga japonensis]